MRIALITSNRFPLDENVHKGTEIFVYNFIKHSAERLQKRGWSMTAFCSNDSRLPVARVAVDKCASSLDASVPSDKHIIFELALIGEAIARQDEFDLYHFNIGNGDIVLPFVRFIRKPVIITLHYTLEHAYAQRYFSLFKNLPNVFFVAPSRVQQRFLGKGFLSEIVHHGVDTNVFRFDAHGGEYVLWAGRMTPEKGVATVLKVVERTRKNVRLFALHTEGEHRKFEKEIVEKILNQERRVRKKQYGRVSLVFDTVHRGMVGPYQSGKLFLFPLTWEEPFGQVLTEAMACGTPVVAFARGAVPEIVKDGETGFLVNQKSSDIRGKWIIKKTGLSGLVEAVERVYQLLPSDYEKMRATCRARVEEKFSITRMVEKYEALYERVAAVSIN